MPEDHARFLVTCAARTGSTMLVEFLQSHPEICAHGEVLAPDGPLDFYGINYELNPPLEGTLLSIRDRDPVAFLHDFVWQKGSRAVSGFKGKYEELLMPEFRLVLEAIVSDPSIKVIHLKREDLLARYLSEYLAIAVYGFYQVRDERDRPRGAKVRLSPQRADEDFQRVEQRHSMFANRLSRHDVLDVTYEQLVQAPSQTLARIQTFLGVTEHDDLRSPSKKLSTQPHRDVIENYDELASHFEGTPYQRLFEIEGNGA
jgi:LPS sulfotransferase NodH